MSFVVYFGKSLTEISTKRRVYDMYVFGTLLKRGVPLTVLTTCFVGRQGGSTRGRWALGVVQSFLRRVSFTYLVSIFSD